MTSNGDAGHSGELTDEQLDQLLDAANEKLLDHVRVTADPSRPLTAIMDSSTPEVAEPAAATDDQTRAALMISMRVRGRDIDQALDQARALLGTFDHRDIDRLDRALDHARALARPFDHCDIDRALARDRGLRRPPVALARSLRERALARASARAHAIEFLLAHGLGFALGHTTDLRAFESALAHDLKRDRVRALKRALKRALVLGGHRIWYYDRNYLADIEGAFLRIRDLERAIIAQPVDASGADLSDLEIGDLDALDGVVWTRQTTWPPSIANQVRKRSYEIRDGVYRVGIGGTPDRHGLTRV